MADPITLHDIIEAAAFIERSQQQRGKGPPQRETCVAGHDLAVHGRQKFKTNAAGQQVKNGRFCWECKRERQRTGDPRPNAQKPRRPGANPHADDYQGPARK